MSSRSRLVAKAFGSSGVLAKATQAVPEEVGGGVEPVANEAALGSGNAGDLKFATATKSAFLYDGAEWDRIQTGSNAAPFFKVAPTAVSLGNQESASVSVLAGDPEGFPITYSWDALKVDSSATVHYKEGSGTYPPGITNIIHSPATSGLFRFQSDSAASGNDGTYTYRILANDGAISSVSTSTLGVSYSSPNQFELKYKAAVEASGKNCTIHKLNATDHANLHDYIDTAAVGTIANDRYDVLLLSPGTYTLTPTTSSYDNYAWDVFRGKAFALVGNTDQPHKVHVTVSGSSSRDYPIFVEPNGSLPSTHSAAKALANLTFKRVAPGSSYTVALRRFAGGLARNVLFDFNNQNLSMNYYNSESGTANRKLTMFAVTFANVGTRDASYSGNQYAFYIGRGFAESFATYNKFTNENNAGTGTLTADGTKYWTYTDNGANHGHLYKVTDTNYTIDLTGNNSSYGMSDANTG
tara:strand:+ start:127 stop:1530 length:1404 start_codon:yes stop_codon:yes gene_type:complete